MASKDGYFRFKEFDLKQENVPFRFGTDSMLIGSWTKAKNPKSILDVGTGSGILALMMAQKYENAKVTGIDISEEAIHTAKKNFERSAFSNRLNAICADWNVFEGEQKYDLIISNPPYFQNNLLGKDTAKNLARHQENFSYEKLIFRSFEMLNKMGVCCFVCPYSNKSEVLKYIENQGLHINRICNIQSNKDSKTIRILICVSRENKVSSKETLCIYNSLNEYSKEYLQLTSPYYLGS